VRLSVDAETRHMSDIVKSDEKIKVSRIDDVTFVMVSDSNIGLTQKQTRLTITYSYRLKPPGTVCVC
jgi:hypothetical protein